MECAHFSEDNGISRADYQLEVKLIRKAGFLTFINFQLIIVCVLQLSADAEHKFIYKLITLQVKDRLSQFLSKLCPQDDSIFSFLKGKARLLSALVTIHNKALLTQHKRYIVTIGCFVMVSVEYTSKSVC